MIDLIGHLQSHEERHGRPKAILIDFFDTIVGRTVEPEYVKARWAKRIRYRAGFSASTQAIHEERVRIEAELCRKSVTRGFDDDFRYLEMAGEVWTHFRRHEPSLDRLGKAGFQRLCEQVEIEVELETQFIHKEALDFLKYLEKQQLPVHLVSDTFLSVRQMKTLLEQWGIQSVFTNMFLSSDCLLAKRTGRLYTKVLESLDLLPTDLLMIGDNIHSDVKNANVQSIPAILVTHEPQHVTRLNAQRASAEVVEAIKVTGRTAGGIFAEFAGAMLFFTAELFRRASGAGFKDLLFCSREGLLLKQFFDRYQSVICGQSIIRTHYFYTSRLASFAPGLHPARLETFDRLLRQYKHLSLRMFLRNLQFEEVVIEQISQKLNHEVDTVIENFAASDIFARLRRLDLFREVYNCIRVDQKKLALEYLSSFFPRNELPPTIAIVDVGWKGTIQDNLRALLGAEHIIEGFYVGLVYPGMTSSNNRKSGLLFSAEPKYSRFFEIFAEACTLFELVLSASHPGVISYRRIDGVVTPLLGTDEKSPNLSEAVRVVQDGVMRRFDALLKSFAAGHVDESEYLEDFAKLFSRFAFSPTREELNLVAAVEHFENFGIFDNTTFAIPKQVGFLSSVRGLLQYVRNPSLILGSSLWPALSLHREGLGGLAPWYAKRRIREIFGDV